MSCGEDFSSSLQCLGGEMTKGNSQRTLTALHMHTFALEKTPFVIEVLQLPSLPGGLA